DWSSDVCSSDLVPVGEGKIGVVFEKVAVGQNVGDDQLVLKQGVGLQQKGVTGIGVDHQLVDFAQAEVVIGFHPVIGFAEAPVGKPGGHSVGADGVEDVRRSDFVSHREKIEPGGHGPIRDLFNRPFQQ